ncbi:MAG: hypothetical protein ACN6QT_04015, partial [Burkholderia contaminans]
WHSLPSSSIPDKCYDESVDERWFDWRDVCRPVPVDVTRLDEIFGAAQTRASGRAVNDGPSPKWQTP